MSVALDHGITSLGPVMLQTVDSTSQAFLSEARSWMAGSTSAFSPVPRRACTAVTEILAGSRSTLTCHQQITIEIHGTDGSTTYLDSPQDIVSWQTAPSDPGYTYRVGPRSMAALYATADSVNRDFTT